MHAIEVHGLRKSYGDVVAVDNIDLIVEQGEVFGLLGPNGAGKTTTTEMLVGLRAPDAGTISILGMNPQKEAKAVKARIGVQLQTAALFNRLTARESLQLMASFFPQHRDVDALLSLVGLQEKAHSQTRHLSGGQLQRLQLAGAMVNDGDIIFLDEPTTGLDPQARRNLWEIIERLRKEGKTVFLTTHYMDEAEKLCDRVAVVDHGRVIALDSPAGLIKTHFKETAVEMLDVFADDNLLGNLPGVSSLQHEDGHVSLFSTAIPATITALMELSTERRVELKDLVMRQATLEDVFLKLTGRRIRS